jgi:hypothetical protein
MRESREVGSHQQNVTASDKQSPRSTEGHPIHQLDRLRRTRAWFDRRLGESTTVQDPAVEDPA